MTQRITRNVHRHGLLCILWCPQPGKRKTAPKTVTVCGPPVRKTR